MKHLLLNIDHLLLIYFFKVIKAFAFEYQSFVFDFVLKKVIKLLLLNMDHQTTIEKKSNN
jgi:hypothetical protein